MEISTSQRRVEHDLPKNELPLRAIARFWTRMAEIYGHKWVSQFGEVCDLNGDLSSAAQTWSQGLASIPMENISEGFSTLVKKGGEWPPSLPEFLAMCQPEKRLAAYHKMVTALPAPRVDPQLVEDSLAQIRAILKGSNFARPDQSGSKETNSPQADNGLGENGSTTASV